MFIKMKSRLITASERIIAYKQEKNLPKLQRISDKLRIKLVIAQDADADSPLGYFAGFEGFSKSEKILESTDPCIIFSGLSSRRIDAVLSEMKKTGLSVPLKAVVTASNQSWSIKKLTAELAKERSALGG